MAAPARSACSCLPRAPYPAIGKVARPLRRRATARTQHTDAAPPPAPMFEAASSSAASSATLAPSPRFAPVPSTSAEPYTPALKEETPVRGLLYATSLEEMRDYRIVAPDDETILAFFARHLPSLAFDPVLATRTLTHPLAAAPHANHNGKLASMGKHVLRAHLAAFVNTHRNLLPDDIEIDAPWLTEVLSQHRLGQGPGEAMGVAAAMRYRETLGVAGDFPRWTHRGQIVEALTGAVYKQHGGLTSLRFFHSRVLPHLAYPSEWDAAVRLAAETDHDLAGTGSYGLDRLAARQRRTLEVVDER